MTDPGTVLGIVFGLPAFGFAVRLVVKPIADAYVRSRELKAGVRDDARIVHEQAARMAQLEAELAAVKDQLERHSAVESFYEQLKTPDSTGALPAK
jgi:hypothetical protein